MIDGPTALAYPGPENDTRLTTLDPSAGYITIINMYTVAPERAEAPLDLLTRGTPEPMGCVQGFVTGNFLINLDRTQVVNSAQWRGRQAIAAAGADPQVAARVREAAQFADGCAPILYKLRDSAAAPVSEDC